MTQPNSSSSKFLLVEWKANTSPKAKTKRVTQDSSIKPRIAQTVKLVGSQIGRMTALITDYCTSRKYPHNMGLYRGEPTCKKESETILNCFLNM